MTVSDQKKAIRKAMLTQRLALREDIKIAYDGWICRELEKIIVQNACKSVHAYIPIANEIDIAPLLQRLLDLDIVVVCPKTLPKRQMENRVLHSLEEVEIGIMGTKHPLLPEVFEGHIDLVIVPGLAFTKAGYRIGYGGAYYDTFLSKNPDARTVGIFYPFQQIDTLPVESHDMPLNTVLFKAFD